VQLYDSNDFLNIRLPVPEAILFTKLTQRVVIITGGMSGEFAPFACMHML